MAQPLPHDWTSAYVDGELSESEARAAEVRLLRDGAARDEVQRFRDIGDLLRSLPVQTLPSEFPRALLLRCERELLLAEKTEGGSPRSVARAVRSWGTVVGSLLTTSALLLLCLRIFSSPAGRIKTPEQNRPGLARKTASPQEKSPVIALRAREQAAQFKTFARRATDRAEKVSDGQAGQKDKDGSARPADDALPAKAYRKTAAGKVVRQTKKPAVKTAAASNGARAPATLGRQRFAGGSAREPVPDAFRVGEVLPYLEVSGDRTAVIEVTVVDVRKAVGHFEVLLAKQSVYPVAAGPGARGRLGTPKLRLDKARMRPHSGPRELIAVYVESTQGQLAAVMKALGKQTGSVHLALKPPVANGSVWLAGMASEAGHTARRGQQPLWTLADAVNYGRQLVPVSPGDRAGSPLPPGKRPLTTTRSRGAFSNQFKSANALKSPAGKAGGNKPSPKFQSAGKASKNDGGKRAGSDNLREQRDESAVRSFQLRVRLLDEVPRDKKNANRPETKSKEERRPKSISSPPSARDKARQTASPPLRVIFVFREQPPATAPLKRP